MMPINQRDCVLKDDLWWTTTVALPSWPENLSQILFAPEGREAEPLTSSEIAQIAWVIENEAIISQSLFESLFHFYPTLQAQYDFSESEKIESMPDIKSAHDLRKLIKLSSINIHQISHKGIPYIGFEFDCSWDIEHGLGVLMHGSRTVEIGHADTAICLWIAEQDMENFEFAT